MFDTQPFNGCYFLGLIKYSDAWELLVLPKYFSKDSVICYKGGKSLFKMTFYSLYNRKYFLYSISFISHSGYFVDHLMSLKYTYMV